MHRRHVLLVDAAVPVLVGAVIVAGTLLHGGTSARPLPVAVGLAAAATLWARRRAPGWTLAISGLLVAVLFQIDGGAGPIAVLAPAVALYSLARARDSGLAIEFEVRGERPARLSDAVSLAAYRIAQESLTNAQRHAAGAAVRVRLGFDASSLSIAVENATGVDARGNGAAPPAATALRLGWASPGCWSARPRSAAGSAPVRARPGSVWKPSCRTS